jgi:hypothetical protein
MVGGAFVMSWGTIHGSFFTVGIFEGFIEEICFSMVFGGVWVLSVWQ